MTGLVNFYILLVKKGSKTIDDVPEKIRKDVQALMESEEQ